MKMYSGNVTRGTMKDGKYSNRLFPTLSCNAPGNVWEGLLKPKVSQKNKMGCNRSKDVTYYSVVLIAEKGKEEAAT